jgi:hypothetical protein
VVSLVVPDPAAHECYIQWCSLLGVNVDCDQRCLCKGARWPSGQSQSVDLTRALYDPLRVVVELADSSVGSVPALELAQWKAWAAAFLAGFCMRERAWRAAEEARRAAVELERDVKLRRLALAAEDAAWAVVHAGAGNLALALESAAGARKLLTGKQPSEVQEGSRRAASSQRDFRSFGN